MGGGGALFVQPLDGGPERQVIDQVYMRGFEVTRHGIYYITLDDSDCVVRLLDPVTLKSTLVGKIGEAVTVKHSYGLAASPDGKTILYAMDTRTDADLALVENFR